MKKIFIATISAILISSAALGQGSIVLDLKTKLSEKGELLPIKLGAEYFLLKDGFVILDASEDYAVWIKDYKKVTSINMIEVTVTVKITKPTLFKEKSGFMETLVRFSYKADKVELIGTDESLVKFIRKKMARASKEALIESEIGGFAVAKEIKQMLTGLKK